MWKGCRRGQQRWREMGGRGRRGRGGRRAKEEDCEAERGGQIGKASVRYVQWEEKQKNSWLTHALGNIYCPSSYITLWESVHSVPISPLSAFGGPHQHKGRPHTHEKVQGAATLRVDAIIICRGLNLHGTHCTVLWLKSGYLHRDRFSHPNIADVVDVLVLYSSLAASWPIFHSGTFHVFKQLPLDPMNMPRND